MKPRLPNTTINEARIFKMVNDVDTLKVTTERQLDGKFAEIEGVLTDTKDTVKEAKTVIGEAKNKIQELDFNFENLSNEVVDVLKEIKETGLKGDKGDDADEEAMEERLLTKIPKIEEIVKGLPTKEELVKEVIKQIPENKPSLKIIQEAINIDEVANKVEEKLNEKPFEIDRVNGLKGKLDNITRDVARKTGYHGGGDTVKAGTNISITTDGTGAKVISATGSGTGSVTDVSVVSANGLAGTVATSTTTPAITLSTTVTGIVKGNGTALSAAVANTDYQSPITLTTTGSSGAATFNGTTLNIPQYTGGSGGTPGGSTTQLQYNNAGAFGGISGATTNGTATTFTTGNLIAHDVKASQSAGMDILSSSGTVTALFGAGGGANSTFYGGVKGDYLTASEMIITDASKNIVSAPVATYPSLTELTYVKGVTSSIQTQLNAKGTGTVTSVSSTNGALTVATGTTTPTLTVNSAPILTTARTIGTITGDATSAGSSFDGSANNTNALTLATVNSNVGSFGSATASGTFTVNAKGLITAASSTTVTPAVGSITGLGTGVATALAVNVGTAGAPVINGGALGTPSSGTVTNLTGTASININGTVGATTPTTGVFTTLTGGSGSADYLVTTGGTGTTSITATGSNTNVNVNLIPKGSGRVQSGGTDILTTTSADIVYNKTYQAPLIDYVIEPASDDTYEGEATNDILAGDTISQWDLVYLDSTSGRWEFTDADAVATSGGVLLALAAASGTDGNAMNVVFRGVVRNDGWTWSGAGKPLYVSTTAGGMTETAPSGASDVIRVVGYTLSDDAIYFNPDNAWVVHA